MDSIAHMKCGHLLIGLIIHLGMDMGMVGIIGIDGIIGIIGMVGDTHTTIHHLIIGT
jgi:hypothetical protein